MAKLKCKRCGADISDLPGIIRENADGSKEGRCPNCSFPYEVPAEKVKPEPGPAEK